MNSLPPITPADQHAFRQSLAPQLSDFDDIDMAAADAEQDLQPRSQRDVARVLAILDGLAIESLLTADERRDA